MLLKISVIKTNGSGGELESLLKLKVIFYRIGTLVMMNDE
jgi:hypothetical protein